MQDSWSAAVLVASDGVTKGTRVDQSGPAAKTHLGQQGFQVTAVDVVADDSAQIASRLKEYVSQRIHLVVTSGGTGFGPRDVTPEATGEVIERDADGLAEYLRRETQVHTPYAVLSRGRAGIAGTTLIINLPGSPKGVKQYLDVLAPLLPHAVKLAAGENPDHGHKKES